MTLSLTAAIVAVGCRGAGAAPVSASAPSASSVDATVGVLGLTLGMTRAAIHQRLSTTGIARETTRHYDDGSVEWRVTLADGTFLRIAFAADGDEELPDAIIGSVAAPIAAAQLQAVRTRFGAPDWTSRSGDRMVWGGRGGAEDAVTPAAGAAQVIAVTQAAGAPLSVTLARARWFESNGG